MFTHVFVPVSFFWLQLRRASVMKDDDANLPVSPAGDQEFPMPEEEEEPPMPFDDEEELPVAVADDSGRLSSLNLSISRDDSSRGAAAVQIGGLDASHEEEEKPKTRRRKRSQGGAQRTRKRRKIEIHDQTELRGTVIKNWLEDTSNIVDESIIHPATWVPGQETSPFKQSDTELLYSHLSHEKLLARPALADDGQLAPEMLQLWARNSAPVFGKPFPYPMLDEDEADIEVARQQREGEEKEEELSKGEESVSPPIDDDEVPMPMVDEDEVPMPMDEEEVPPQDTSGFAHDLEGLEGSEFCGLIFLE